MKKFIIAILLCGLVASTLFSEEVTYEDFYNRVYLVYGEKRLEDFTKIWNYAVSINAKNITWEVIVKLLDNPQCLCGADKDDKLFK